MSMSPRDEEDGRNDGCIRIPVRGAQQTVEVYTEELPSDYNDVVDVLKAEIAPLDIWLRFAVEYYRQGSEAHFRGILNEIIEALTPETERFYADDRRAFDVGRIRILNALAADSVKQASMCTDRSARDDQYTAALSHLTSADRIDNMSELTWVGKGVFYLCQGELDRAKYFFENARKQRHNFPATLGEAAVNFHHGNYKQALDLYSEAIRVNPECSASVRVGFGLCCYKLGQTSRAQAAMARALQLDPQNVQALVGSAILELSAAPAGSEDAARRTESAINTISMAYHVDSKNAMVLNHLANHYFWTWSPLKAVVSTEQGARSGTISGDLKHDLATGDVIRIGAVFETAVGGEGCDGTTLHLRDEFVEPSGDALDLYTKDYRKVVELANTAYENTTAPEIKAESCYLKARVHHAMGNLNEARLLYDEACHLWPQFPLAQYGMAQMLVNEGNIEPAVKALDAVLAEEPDNEEALVLLGVLYAKHKQRLPALSKFKRALELNPHLSDAWIAQAQVLQEDPTDHRLALSSYSKGLGDANAGGAGMNPGRGIRHTSGLETHQAAWTNIAVLHEHLGNPVEAMSAYEHAFNETRSGLRRADDNVDSDALLRITDPANQLFWEWKELPATASTAEGSRTVRTSAPIGAALRKGTQVRVGERYVTTAQGPEKDGVFEVADMAPGRVDGLALEGQLFKKVHKIRVTKENVSMVFNLALLHEKQGHHEAAQELHKAVLAEHPTYVNSYLRLGIMARDSGQIHEASKWFKQALEVDGENPDIVAYIGNLHMHNSEWGPAQKKFEKILEMPGLRGDSYANLSLGNIYFSNLEDRTKYEKHLLHAANFYHEVLKKDDANAFSANGLGMVLAEKGTLDHAKDVFARVREVSAEVLGDVWINLAHVYLAQNKHNEAIRLYQNCLKKFHGGRDPSLHIYLAHAYFDARQYNDCMRVLLKALHVSPNNLQLWYNLALARETFAVAVLQKEQKGEARTLAEVENAIEDLKGATKLFSWLKDCKPDRTGGVRHLPYDASKAEKHAKFCFDNIERAAQHLNHEKMKADQQQEVRERHQRALEKMVQQRKQEEEEERRRQEAHALEREERAKIKQASLNKMQESWTTQTHTELSKPGGGKRGRGGEQGSGQAPQYESGSEDEAEELSENDEEEAGQADRYGDGAGTSDTPAPLPPQPNLKDIGLSSSSEDSDDAFGGDEEREVGGGQKRKWDSDDDEAGQADQTASKRQTVEDSD
eukprot:g2024.t1